FVETDLDKLEKAKLGGRQQPPGPQHQGNATNGDSAKIQGPSNDAASAKTQGLNDSVPTAGSIAPTPAAGPDPPSEESGQGGHTTKESDGALQPEKDVPQNEAGHSKEKDNTAPPEQHDTNANSSSNKNNQVAEERKNDKIAVILKMRLGSSTYATMALRELMKEGGVRTWKVEYGGGRR
ncbi:MAG: hypothetical protein LQ341_007446, partial [Variospora aurantia]